MTAVTACATARVMETVPPPAGTVAEPLLLVVPLLTVSCSVAPPHVAGRTPTAALVQLAPTKVGVTLSPAAVQRGGAASLAPVVWVVRLD